MVHIGKIRTEQNRKEWVNKGWKIGLKRTKDVTVEALYWNRNEEEII